MPVICPICHEEITSSRTTLSCSHAYHYQCISKLVRINPNAACCPVCFRKIQHLPVQNNPQPRPQPVSPRPPAQARNQNEVIRQFEQQLIAQARQQRLEQAIEEQLLQAVHEYLVRAAEEEMIEAITEQYMTYLYLEILRQLIEEGDDESTSPSRPRPIEPAPPQPRPQSPNAQRLGCAFLCACIFPPFAVFLARGCSCALLLNILLTLLVFVPGCCHACFIVAREIEDDE